MPAATPVLAWLRQGQALEAQSTITALTAAVQCYDRALAALRDLAPAGDATDRDLGVAWMNRGNALQKLGDAPSLAAAVAAYDQAITLLKKLPSVTDPACANSLGAAWMNRGHALQQSGPAARPGAVHSHRQAVAILQSLPLADYRPAGINLGAAWMNLANALLGLTPPEADAAHQAARDSLTTVALLESTDALAAEVSLKARRVLCEAIGHRLVAAGIDREVVAALADEADTVIARGLDLARHWETRGCREFQPLAGRLLLFGARLFLIHQPQFLAEFLLEQSVPAGQDAPLTTAALRAVAAEFIPDALDTLRSTSLLGLSEREQERIHRAADALTAAAATLRLNVSVTS